MGTAYSDFVNNVLSGVKVVTVTSPFGPRTYKNSSGVMVSDTHQGIDLTPVSYVMAPAKAMVKAIYSTVGSGNIIELEHGAGYTTVYKHLADRSTVAKVGDILDPKALFTKAGGTGASVTGPHLHYEVRIKDVPQDPLPYLQGKLTIPDYVPVTTQIVSAPVLPKLLAKMVVNVRDAGGTAAKDIGDTAIGTAYPYLGKTKSVNGYQWARIDYFGQIGYVALNPDWNTIVLPDPVVVEVVKPITISQTENGVTYQIIISPAGK
jgi:hypothetical protein